jgi:hypothetical protein
MKLNFGAFTRTRAPMPTEREIAAALLHEARRIERNTNARADLRHPHC